MDLWILQFLAGLVGGVLAFFLIERVESSVKWLGVLLVVVGVLSVGGAVKASEVQRVDDLCQGGQTEACTILKAFLLAVWKGTIPMFAGFAVGGLGTEALLKNQTRK